MLFFLANGYRVVAHDRRGHGRSSQVDTGNDMDHYAADASAVVEHLNLKNAIHIGHSTGGGEVARYVARYGEPQGRVAKAVLVSSVPPLMLKTAANPDGTADRGVRQLPRGARREPRGILHLGRFGPFLRLQPAGRDSLPRRSSKIGGARA